MKKSELKSIIREEIINHLYENIKVKKALNFMTDNDVKYFQDLVDKHLSWTKIAEKFSEKFHDTVTNIGTFMKVFSGIPYKDAYKAIDYIAVTKENKKK